MKSIITSVLCICGFYAFSQNIILNSFNAGSDGKQVRLSWIIAKGNTCNGMSILRSSDSVYFHELGEIAGICGSTSEPVGYNFTDTAPVINKPGYYRLRLGSSQLSHIIKVVHISSNTPFALFPNPAATDVNILIGDADTNPYILNIYNLKGNLVATHRINTKSYVFKRAQLISGLYVYQLTTQSKTMLQGLLQLIDTP